MNNNITQPIVITNRNLIGKIFNIWIDMILKDIYEILELKEDKILKNVRKKINIEYIVFNKLRNNLIKNK